MFEKFGEFDSCEEINRAAAAQKEQGDEEALILLAQENGIDKEEAEDFYDGVVDALTNPTTAAIGKLAVESADLKLGGVLEDWVDELRTKCIESETFARAVRRKGKDLAEYIALMIEEGYKNREVVDRRIVDKTKQVKEIIRPHDFIIGITDKRTRRRLMEEYYLGKEAQP